MKHSSSLNKALLVALLVAMSGGCDILDPSACHHGIFYRVEPDEAVIAVGESFTPTATVKSCPAGSQPLTVRWSAEDPTVVEVDAQSGRTTGLSEGETAVQGTDTDDQVLVSVRVMLDG